MALSTQERVEAAMKLLRDTDLGKILREAKPVSQSPAKLSGDSHELEQRSTTITTSSRGKPQTLTQAIMPPSNLHSHPLPQPLTISLHGLSAFPTLSDATVLYARAHDATARLHSFCIALRQQFIDAGFIEEKRDLVLHATLVNIKKNQGRRSGGGRGMGKITIDARRLAGVYNGEGSDSVDGKGGYVGTEEYVWAEGVEIDRVRICKMGAKKVEDETLGQEYEVVFEKMVFSNDT
jgi:AKAP7 2'5' RNA ligase-like domain